MNEYRLLISLGWTTDNMILVLVVVVTYMNVFSFLSPFYLIQVCFDADVNFLCIQFFFVVFYFWLES